MILDFFGVLEPFEKLTEGSSYSSYQTKMCLKFQGLYLSLGSSPSRPWDKICIQKFICEVISGNLERVEKQVGKGRKSINVR